MKKIEVLIAPNSKWATMLDEFFTDTEALIHFASGPQEIHTVADLILIEPALISLSLLQKIKVQRQSNPALRLFALGEPPEDQKKIFDGILTEPGDLIACTKILTGCLPMPETVRLLIADDDQDILDMAADYFEGRHAPQFMIERAKNGKDAWDLIQIKKPDAIILDIKMPLMTGRELYCKLQKQRAKIPTLIFYDAIAAGDLDAIRAARPMIVEKGYRESSMPYLMALVKKLIYFSPSSSVN